MALAAIGQQAKMPSVLFHIPGIAQDFSQQEMGLGAALEISLRKKKFQTLFFLSANL